MGTEIFLGWKLVFSVCVLGSVAVSAVLCALLAGVLWCGSTWSVVRFNVGMGAHWACWSKLCGERNLKRRRQLFTYTFFYHVEKRSCAELRGCRHTVFRVTSTRSDVTCQVLQAVLMLLLTLKG